MNIERWSRGTITPLWVAVFLLVAAGSFSALAAADQPAAGAGKFVSQPSCRSLPAGTVKYSAEGLASGAGAHRNELLSGEPGRDWRLLFDGESLAGWSGFQRSTVPPAWHVEEDALAVTKFVGDNPTDERGDLRWGEAFDNFELRLQWAASPGANSGIFFLVQEGVAEKIWQAAPELQVLDDPRHEDGAALSHRAGGLYDVYAPRCNALKPAGEYNDVRLIVRDGHVEHWLNGYQIIEYDLDSAEFRARVARSKFRDAPHFAKVRRGSIALQDHGDRVLFRNIRARTL